MLIHKIRNSVYLGGYLIDIMITILFFIGLLSFSALFSATETSFFSLSHARVRLMMDKKRFAANIIYDLKKQPRRLLIAILLGNNAVNIFTASYATVIATRYFESGALGAATGLSTIMILMFGEVIPKSLAIAKKERVAQFTAWPMRVIFVLLYPVVLIVHGINLGLYKILRVSQSHDHVTEEEIRVMTRMGVEHGVVLQSEHTMIENVFQFDDILVGDVMTPIENVEAISASVPIEQIAFVVSQIGHSRYPVHEGNDDAYVGYIHVNTIMQKLNSDERDRPVGDFVSPVHYIDENITIEKAFRRMSKKYAHMFIVQNAQKENIGLVTLEDILEELVGEIIDETDMST